MSKSVEQNSAPESIMKRFPELYWRMLSARLRAESPGDDAAISVWCPRFPKRSRGSGVACRFARGFSFSCMDRTNFHGDWNVCAIATWISGDCCVFQQSSVESGFEDWVLQSPSIWSKLIHVACHKRRQTYSKIFRETKCSAMLCLVVILQNQKGCEDPKANKGYKTRIYFSTQAYWRRPVFSEIKRQVLWFWNLSISTMWYDR